MKKMIFAVKKREQDKNKGHKSNGDKSNGDKFKRLKKRNREVSPLFSCSFYILR